MKKLFVLNTYFECISKLSEYLNNYPSNLDKKNIVFCEEKMTLLIERKIAENSNCGFNTMVFSLNRYQMKKINSDNLLSKEGATIFIRKLILENISNLKLLSGSKMKNLAPLVYELLAQLKSANISSEDFKNAVGNTEGGLKNKLNDISFIFSLYEKSLSENGLIDQNNFLSLLPSTILSDDEIKNANIFIFGYSNFTKQSKLVMKALNAVCNNVTAFLVGGDNNSLYTNEAIERYISIADELKIDLEIEKQQSKNNKEAENIQKFMFDTSVFDKRYQPVETNNIFLYEAENNLEEIEHIALIIKRDIIKKKVRYRDFMVATNNISEYSETVKSVFSKYEIPFFVDQKIKLSDNILSKLIIDFIEVYKKGFYQKDVISFIKNPLIFDDLDFIDEFENYIIKNGITRGGFYKEIEEEDKEKARKKIVNLVLELKGKATAIEYSEIIKRFLDRIDIEQQIESYTKKIAFLGITEEETILTQSLDKIIEVLDEIKKLLGGTYLTLDEFKTVLLSGLISSEISVLPQFNDAVFVGEFKECRQVRAKTLFMIGLNGNVPTSKSDIALLSDGDIDKLYNLKLAIEPKIRIINKREKENIGLTMMSFSDKLYLSYSQLSSNGKSVKKSEIFLSLEKMFTHNKKPLAFMNKILLDSYIETLNDGNKNYIEALDYITEKEGIIKFSESATKFKNSIKNDFTVPSSFYFAVKEESRKILDGILDKNGKEIEFILDNNKEIITKNDKLSATTIENFYTCPYRNFLERGLKIDERESSDVRFIDAGSFVHDIFDIYTKEMKSEFSREESDLLTENIAERLLNQKKYSVFLLSSQNKNLFERLLFEAKTYTYKLYSQYLNTDFKYFRSEAKFGIGEEFKPIKFRVREKDYYLEGKVDRIDKYEDYIRIIDYKTGKVETTDKFLFVGEKLQLYLYIQAFIDKFKPSGIYYYPIDNSFKKESDTVKELFGYTLENQDILRAGDNSLSLEKNKSNITGSLVKADKKTGEIIYSNQKSLSEKELDSYIKYAYDIALKGAYKIDEGLIVASPFEGACDYCAYKSICDFEYDSEKPRKVKKVNTETIVCAVENKEDENNAT